MLDPGEREVRRGATRRILSSLQAPRKEVMLMKRGFRLTIAWSRGSVSVTLEPY
jgi:hypothetical protein